MLTAPHLGSRKALSNDGKVRIVIQVEVLGLWPLADGIDCKHDNCAWFSDPIYVSMYGFVWLCAEAWPMAWLPADDIDYKHDICADLLIQCCCVCAALCDFVLGQGRRPVGDTRFRLHAGFCGPFRGRKRNKRAFLERKGLCPCVFGA